jgi:bile acid:Na+ symporter, BASS family
MDVAAVILLVLKASIMLAVFAIGLRATFADMTFLFRHPGLLARSLLSMDVLMPLLALLIGVSFDLHPAVKITLVAIAVSPIPPILPKKVMKAGGQEDYTIGLLVAIALLSIIVIPITMEIFERILSISLVMPPKSVAIVVLTTILLPLTIGIIVRKIAQTFADRIARPVRIFAMVLLILCALPILIGSGRAVLSLVGNGTILCLASFALIGCIIGHLLGGPEPNNRLVLAIATASRHPAIALAIAHTNFPKQKFAAAGVFWYVILSLIISALYLAWAKRRLPESAPI